MARRRRVHREISDKLVTDALFSCCLCPQHTAITIEKHHVLPISEDGDNSEDNLIAVCGSCHDAIHLARDAGRQIYTREQLAICKRRWVERCWESGSSQQLQGWTESPSDVPGTASRGPTPIARFLAEIGMPSQESEPRSRFLHLPDLYVKPRQYDRILSILEEQHAVIVVGEPHMGKTYTALHILWEHFLKGRRVVLMTRDVLAAELHQCGGSVDEFASRQLHDECTLCLDDPFGETEYRPLGPIQKDLLRLLHEARQRQRCGVIITSRLSILGEAFERLEGADSLEADIRAEIRVHTSYSQPVLRKACCPETHLPSRARTQPYHGILSPRAYPCAERHQGWRRPSNEDWIGRACR